MNNKIALESLSMDLKRIAIGYHRGSYLMAKRFYEEALSRKKEIDMTQIKPYLKDILEQIPKMEKIENKEKVAEDFLMFSTLVQNYTQKFLCT